MIFPWLFHDCITKIHDLLIEIHATWIWKAATYWRLFIRMQNCLSHSMTFPWLFAPISKFHDVSMTLPNFSQNSMNFPEIPENSIIFPWPWQPWVSIQPKYIFIFHFIIMQFTFGNWLVLLPSDGWLVLSCSLCHMTVLVECWNHWWADRDFWERNVTSHWGQVRSLLLLVSHSTAWIYKVLTYIL